MFEKLNKIRKENPDFDRKLVNMFANNMPDLLNVMIDGDRYDCHIVSKDVANLAEKYITDSKGNKIGFHWTYNEIMDAVKNMLNFDDVEFYPCDLFVWANVKYGDMEKVLENEREDKKEQLVIGYAISELTDDDFPFYPASQRAYKWLKKHIENEESK